MLTDGSDKPMRLWKAISPVGCLLTLLVIGAPLAGRTQETTPEIALTRLSFSSGWDALPAVVALERGFFAQEGVIVSGLAVSSAEAAINSLAAGSTDMAAVPQRVFLVMVAANAPVKAVAIGGWGTEMELVAKPGAEIRSVADLKGKKVAVLQGSEAFPVLIRLLNRAGLNPADVDIKSMPGDELTKALGGDAADAVFETRYFTAAMAQSGQGTVVMTADAVTQAIGSIDALPLVARSEVIEKEPETVQKVVTAWIKALKYIEQDPEDASRLLQIFFHRQGVRITTETALSWVRMAKYNQYIWSPAAIADAEYNGWALNVGNILKVAPKLAGFVDNRFAEQAVKTIDSGP